MRIIDSLPEVLDILAHEPDQFTIEFSLTGFPAQQRYPIVKIIVNDKELWHDVIQGNQRLTFDNLDVQESFIQIDIHYLGKTENDTVMIDSKMIENQHVKICYIKINGITISGNELIDISSTDYDLRDNQKRSYSEINAAWSKVKTDTLYDNGVWSISLNRPIVTNLIKYQQRVNRVFEMPHQDILNRMQNYFISRKLI